MTLEKLRSRRLLALCGKELEVTELDDADNPTLKIMMIVYENSNDYTIKEVAWEKDYGVVGLGNVFIVNESFVDPSFELKGGESLGLIIYIKAGRFSVEGL